MLEAFHVPSFIWTKPRILGYLNSILRKRATSPTSSINAQKITQLGVTDTAFSLATTSQGVYNYPRNGLQFVILSPNKFRHAIRLKLSGTHTVTIGRRWRFERSSPIEHLARVHHGVSLLLQGTLQFPRFRLTSLDQPIENMRVLLTSQLFSIIKQGSSIFFPCFS